MPKDTKSLGNNKAPACESRGFVRKKEGVLFDTPSFFYRFISVTVVYFLISAMLGYGAVSLSFLIGL